MWRTLGMLVLFAHALTACETERPPPPPHPDYGGGPRGDPTDADRVGCVPGALAGVDPVGLWHLSLDLDLPILGQAMRIERAGETLRGTVDSGLTHSLVELDDVRFSADEFFARGSVTESDGLLIMLRYFACDLEGDGALRGFIQVCYAASGASECIDGSFRAVRTGPLDGEAPAVGIELLRAFSGDPPWPEARTLDVKVRDSVAYVVRAEDGLRVVDVADVASMHDVAHVAVSRPERHEYFNDIELGVGASGAPFAVVASSERGVVALDVTRPEAPVELSSFGELPPAEPSRNVHTVFIEQRPEGARAYLANVATRGLEIYDVSDPRAPVRLGSWVHPAVPSDYWAYLHDMHVEDGIAYLAYWTLGLVVLDTRDPSAITLLGQYSSYEPRTAHSAWATTTSGGRHVCVLGDEGFGGHLRVLDVDSASASFMTAIGELSLRPEVSSHNFTIVGDLVYAAYYQDGVRVVNIADPSDPVVVAHVQTWDPSASYCFFEGAAGIDPHPAAGLLYIADTLHGLIVARTLF